LAGINDWNALMYVVSQHALAAQAFEVSKEENNSDIGQDRLHLLEGIDNAIQRLVNLSASNAMMNKPIDMFDKTHIT